MQLPMATSRRPYMGACCIVMMLHCTANPVLAPPQVQRKVRKPGLTGKRCCAVDLVRHQCVQHSLETLAVGSVETTKPLP